MPRKNDFLDVEEHTAEENSNRTLRNGYAGPFTIRKRIGATMYEVAVYFSRENRESLEDKIIRMVRNEALNGGMDQ